MTDRDKNSSAEAIAKKTRAWTPTKSYPYGKDPVFTFDYPLKEIVFEIDNLCSDSYLRGFEAALELKKE